jgi:L-threonylcarbamoyladenylate synthase
MNFEQELTLISKMIVDGKTILYPTDTIWGLGCNALITSAVEKIFEIKNRPATKSCIVLMRDEAMLKQFVDDIPTVYFDLKSKAQKPTTFIFKSNGILKYPVCSEQNTIAVRIPNDAFCNELLQLINVPLLSTSANVSGEPSPSNFNNIQNSIKQNVDYVVSYRQDDETESAASAIIDISSSEIKVIRA